MQLTEAGFIFRLDGLGLASKGLEVHCCKGQARLIPAGIKAGLDTLQGSRRHRRHFFIKRLLLSPKSGNNCLKSPQGLPAFSKAALDRSPYDRHPYGVLQTGSVRQRKACGQRFQPPFREGLALRIVVERLHDIIKDIVPPLGTIGIGKVQKALFSRLIFLLKQLFQHILTHKDQFLLIGKPELRIEIDRRKILPNDGLTKGMQRRYGCIGKQYQLALQAFIARVRRNRLLQFTLDTGPHFRSGGPGKGDDQQTVDIPGLHPLLPGQQMTQDTVDQHRCLTGSGSRRNQQILMTQRNGLPLLR